MEVVMKCENCEVKTASWKIKAEGFVTLKVCPTCKPKFEKLGMEISIKKINSKDLTPEEATSAFFDKL